VQRAKAEELPRATNRRGESFDEEEEMGPGRPRVVSLDRSHSALVDVSRKERG